MLKMYVTFLAGIRGCLYATVIVHSLMVVICRLKSFRMLGLSFELHNDDDALC